MKLIVGLGNPGPEYQGTRHNVGFVAIGFLSQRYHIAVRSRRSQALVGEGFIGSEKVILARPMTFMNLSGQAVSGLMRHYRLTPADVIILCDDVNLPLGRLRIRASGSAGGHNGLKSIIHSLGSDAFPRVRIGIGSPRHEMIDHVLGKFHRSEREAVEDATTRAADAAETIVQSGIDTAMNQFNPAPPPK